MTYKEFEECIMEKLLDALGDDYSIEPRQELKNNGSVLSGITIKKREEEIAPVIYPECFYKQMLKGRSEDEILTEIIEIYNDSYRSLPEVVSELTDFDAAKERVAYKLIRRSGNEQLLTDIPFTPYLDLAIVYYLLLDTNRNGQITALIHNEHMETWGITSKELQVQAEKNTPKILPASMRPIEHVICEGFGENSEYKEETDRICEEMMEGADNVAHRLYVLTNQNGTNGASCILYEGVLEAFAKEQEADVIILPSSIHEVILLADRGGFEMEELKEMVGIINETSVPKEDVLSDCVYMYECGEKKLSVIA